MPTLGGVDSVFGGVLGGVVDVTSILGKVAVVFTAVELVFCVVESLFGEVP